MGVVPTRCRVWSKQWEGNYGRHRPLPQDAKRPIVLIDGDGWELTLRELVFSILILGVMFFIGFLISDFIEQKINDNNLKYNQAVALQSNSEFKHAMDTDVGFIFANGTLTADKPVRNKHLDGEWLQVEVQHQRYQMHTRRVPYTVTDGKGRTHTRYRTETYWSWDTVGGESEHSPTVTYCGIQFPYHKFYYGDVPTQTSKHSTGWHKRDVVQVTPMTFNATVFANAKGGDLTGEQIQISLRSMEDYRRELTKSPDLVVFWIIWGLFMGGALAMFYYGVNDWLED